MGFVFFVELLNLLAFGLDFSLHWSQEAVESIEDPEPVFRLGLILGLPMAGLLVTSCQVWVLRRFLSRWWPWLLSGPAGFGLLILLVWPLREVWGKLPGAVEPFSIVGGGLLATGVLQWLTLRRQGVTRIRWLVLWIVGLPVGMLVSAIVIMGSGKIVGYPPWPLELALIGLFVGGTAAVLSGKALFGEIASEVK